MKKIKTKQTFYDQVPFQCEERSRIWFNRLKKVLDFNSLKDKKIIDIGCGPGIISDIFQKSGAEVYALDISKEEIALTKKRNPELHTFVASALKLPFPDKKFNISISNGVLHHTKNCRKGFKEAARVVKKDGEVIISLYTKYHPYPFVYNFSKIFTKNKNPNKVPRFLTSFFQRIFNLIGKKITYQETNNLLADALYTPIATFHSKKQIEKWGGEEGLKLIQTRIYCLGILRLFHFKKQND